MRLLRFPALLLLAACGHRGAARAPGVPTRLAEQVAVISADSGPRSFASVRSLLFSPAGELYVVDQRDKQVKVFDTTGSFLRFLGRSGSGPGEYQDPYSVAWLHDTLALLDPGNARIGLYAPGDTWAGTLQVQPISGGSDVRLYRTGTAEFWAYGYKVVDRQAQSLFVRYTGAGARDTLDYLRTDGPSFTISCEIPRGIRFFTAPFAPSDLQTPTPAGARAFARTDRYRIAILGPTGDTLRVLARDEPLATISDSAWEAGLDEWREFRRETPGAKCDGSDFARPRGKPILGALLNGPDGDLWVEVNTPEGTRYDIWRGAHLAGSITGLPASNEVDLAFFGDMIALALPDAGNGPGVGIYRLSRIR